MKSAKREFRRKRWRNVLERPNLVILISTFHFSLFTLCACHTPAPLITLPPVAWASAAEATALLNARRDAVRTVQTQATLTFTPVEGKSQTLNAQLVHDAPDRARLRASKMNHNVFDLTVTPEGVWTAVSSRVTDEAPDAEAGLVRLARVLPFLLRGPDYGDATPVDRQQKQQLDLIWPSGLIADLDAATLTPLRFAIADPEKPGRRAAVIEPVYTLYESADGPLPWLRSAAATGDFGRIELTFYDVALNEALNPRAFRAPRRATAHPVSDAPRPEAVSHGS